MSASTWIAVALLLGSSAVIALTVRAHRRHGPPGY
jgi:hypothetical protein